MAVGIKICGLTNNAAIQSVNNANITFAGFIFFPASPRHLPFIRAAELKANLSSAIHSVSVLVDPDDALINEAVKILQPDYIQLHGKETPERVIAIKKSYPGIKIIKALSIRTSDDVASAKQYEACADILLFDAKPPELAGMLPGGNGLSFDWALLKDRQFTLPWMLSGGLNAENVAQAVRESGASIVDVSSSVESAPGVKDPALIEAFVKAVKTL